MNAADVLAWCQLEYTAEFGDDGVGRFVGECIAMNVDPRMRPRQVKPKRGEDGRVYAHRLTHAMEATAEARFREMGITHQWCNESIVASPEKREELGSLDAGDAIVRIELHDTQDLARWCAELDRRLGNQIEQLSQKPTFNERQIMRDEIARALGPQPGPRVTVGIGILPASANHDDGVGRHRITRMQRAALLARRDALDQRFPELFADR